MNMLETLQNLLNDSGFVSFFADGGWKNNFELSFLFSFKDKKKRFHDSKSICHLQIHRTDVKRGINHNNSAN